MLEGVFLDDVTVKFFQWFHDYLLRIFELTSCRLQFYLIILFIVRVQFLCTVRPGFISPLFPLNPITYYIMGPGPSRCLIYNRASVLTSSSPLSQPPQYLVVQVKKEGVYT